MTSGVFTVQHPNWAYNRSKHEKERLKLDDAFLVISDDGYIVAVRLRDLNHFSFALNSFDLYMRPYGEADDDMG